MGILANLQRSFAYRVSKLFPSEMLRWIDAISDVGDVVATIFIPVPVAGQVPTSTGSAWETIGLSTGSDLPDADITIQASEGNVRFLRTPGLTGNHTVTLGVATATENEIIGIVRESASLFTLAIVNGGPAAGTMYTFPASDKRVAFFRFDSVNWEPLTNARIT